MKLHLPSYSQGSHFISEVIDPAEIKLNNSQFSRAIEIQIHLNRNDPYLRLNYHFSTIVTRVCDRCLEDYEYTLNSDGMLLFVLGKDIPSAAETDDEIRYLPEKTLDIDLSADIRDVLTISLPIKSLCRDDCKGLCSQCGQNLNEAQCRCSRS